jgi:hypothetical protein
MWGGNRPHHALVDEAHYARRKNPTAGSQARPAYGYLYLAIQEEGFIDAPQPLLQASLDAVCRLGNGLKRKRAELCTAEVLARLSREIGRWGS